MVAGRLDRHAVTLRQSLHVGKRRGVDAVLRDGEHVAPLRDRTRGGVCLDAGDPQLDCAAEAQSLVASDRLEQDVVCRDRVLRPAVIVARIQADAVFRGQTLVVENGGAAAVRRPELDLQLRASDDGAAVLIKADGGHVGAGGAQNALRHHKAIGDSGVRVKKRRIDARNDAQSVVREFFRDLADRARAVDLAAVCHDRPDVALAVKSDVVLLRAGELSAGRDELRSGIQPRGGGKVDVVAENIPVERSKHAACQQADGQHQRRKHM